MVSLRHAKANNPHTADYNPKKENNYIMYHNANNLYGLAMNTLVSSGLPRMTKTWQIKRKTRKGWILTVDLEYPK